LGTLLCWLQATGCGWPATSRFRFLVRDSNQLRFQERLHAVFAAFAADAALLPAAERPLRLAARIRVVDANHAVFERLRDAPARAKIARVHIGGEPVVRVIGAGDNFFFGLERNERGDRTERLLLENT